MEACADDGRCQRNRPASGGGRRPQQHRPKETLEGQDRALRESADGARRQQHGALERCKGAVVELDCELRNLAPACARAGGRKQKTG